MTEENVQQRLQNLPTAVLNAIHSDLVFLVWPKKVQHFPARNWRQAQFKKTISDYFTTPIYTTFQNYSVVFEKNSDLILILPGMEQ